LAYLSFKLVHQTNIRNRKRIMDFIILRRSMVPATSSNK